MNQMTMMKKDNSSSNTMMRKMMKKINLKILTKTQMHMRH